MRINTKTGSIDLTKREQQTLADCKSLLLQIHKHGEGEVTDHAEECAELIGAIQADLSGIEGALVVAGGEIVKPPY